MPEDPPRSTAFVASAVMEQVVGAAGGDMNMSFARRRWLNRLRDWVPCGQRHDEAAGRSQAPTFRLYRIGSVEEASRSRKKKLLSP